MDIKEAIKKAISCVNDLFSDEKIEHVGLEEARYNEEEGSWEITIGFSRQWDDSKSNPVLSELFVSPRRYYKIVKIDDASGEVKAIEIREVAHA